MIPPLENLTDLDQLEAIKRFFVYGALEIGDRIQLLLAGRFPGRFYGFLSDYPVKARRGNSAYTIRYWKDVLPLLGPDDFVFLTQGGNPTFEQGLANKSIRCAQPFNIVSVYETYETPTFLAFCRTYLRDRKGIALDVGGNTGLTGAMLASYCDHVYVFEPNPALESVIADTNGGTSNLSVIMKGVSRHSGEITLYPAGQNNMTAVPKDPVDPITVPCISLDDFCRQSDVVPAVIKIDVEGVDAEVIFGAAHTIETHRPLLFLEHPLVNLDLYETDRECAQASLAFLQRFYDLYAYPALDQLLPAEAMGAPLEDFQERFGQLPFNVAAIPKR
jgi:FkbM family methyltransferase